MKRNKDFRRKRIKLESYPVTIRWEATLECGHTDTGTMTAKKWLEGERPPETITCWKCERATQPKLNIKQCTNCSNGSNGKIWSVGAGWITCETCGGTGTLPAN